MKVLFVHDFGGEDGGRMEDALCASFAASKHTLVPFRWKAGNLRSMTLQTGGYVLGEALSEINSLRATARVLHAVSQCTNENWDNALVNTTLVYVALRGTLHDLAKVRSPFIS